MLAIRRPTWLALYDTIAEALIVVVWGTIVFALLLLLFGASKNARGDEARERRTDAPRLGPTTANAPIPPALHLKNTGGSDGAGLCVPSSLTINGRYQGVPGIEDILPLARTRPGGYGPDKLAGLLRETVPGEKYASYVGTDTAVLAKLSAQGLPVGATMNTGQLYGYRPIHHMVSLAHYDERADLACVVDNNEPGTFVWMKAREFARRWIDGGTGWAFVWLRRRLLASLEHRAAALMAAASVVVACLVIRRRIAPPQTLDDEAPDDGRGEQG